MSNLDESTQVREVLQKFQDGYTTRDKSKGLSYHPLVISGGVVAYL